MCGIFGVSLSPSSSVDVHLETSSAVQKLIHRGPDSFGTFSSQSMSIGFAHTRLSIQDLSPTGHQPMATFDDELVISFNGEIYNATEIRSSLIDDGYCFLGSSDTEVLLNSCHRAITKSSSSEEFKVNISNTLNKLNGIFAFALYIKSTDSILLVRDGLGVKPLYTYEGEHGFYFSSESKAFTDVSGQVDVFSIYWYLNYLFCPGTGTPLRQVRKVPPGSACFIRDGKTYDSFSWFALSSTCSQVPSPESKDKAFCISHTRNLLRKAVHSQMVGDVPVGAFLSGGLDSTSVVAFAKELNPSIQCFTIDTSSFASDEGFANDLHFATYAASFLDVPLSVIKVSPYKFIDDIKKAVYMLDEPLADPAALNLFYISKLARESGIRVLLSGAGGDDVFSGYRRHIAFDLEKYWNHLPYRARALIKNFSHLLPASYPLSRRFRKMFSGATLSPENRMLNYFAWGGSLDLFSLFSRDFAVELKSVYLQDPIQLFLSGLPECIDPLQRMLLLEQRFFLADHNLMYTDKMSMANGVEVRVPFLDPALMSFASSIPSCYKVRRGVAKWVLKKAMEPVLPRSIIYRSKTGFNLPLRSWMRNELRDWIHDTLSPDRLKRRGIFDPSSVQTLIAQNQSGSVDATYPIFSLACIEIWFQALVDSSNT